MAADRYSRLNQYRAMWVMVLFDLPTETKKERKIAAKFRKTLLDDGFTMFQFSIYMRFCASRENADVHIKRVKFILPGSIPFCVYEFSLDCIKLTFTNKPARPARTKI